EGGQRDAEDGGRTRPGGIAVAQGAVAGEERAEGHGVGGEERPHAELAPALRGERRLGRFDERVLGGGGGAHVRLSSGPWAGRTRRRTMTSARRRLLRRRWAKNKHPPANPEDGEGNGNREDTPPVEAAAPRPAWLDAGL